MISPARRFHWFKWKTAEGRSGANTCASAESPKMSPSGKPQLWRLCWNADTIFIVIVIVVLVGGLLIFRAAGALGVAAFATWVASARWALAAMFLFTGVAHFTKAKYSMARMVPRTFGNAMAMVYFTGV
jgi:hypothetical protein